MNMLSGVNKLKKLSAILILMQITCSIKCLGQNTWFKYLAPFTASQSFYQRDTITSLGLLSVKGGKIYNTISFCDKDGNLIKVDSIKSLNIDSLAIGVNYAPREKYYSSIEGAGKFRFGMIYQVQTKFGLKQHSVILDYPNLDAVVKLNYDTFNTTLKYYDRINGIEYATIEWTKKIDKLSSTSNSIIYKIEKGIPKILISMPSQGVCASCHQYSMSIIKGDRTSSNLFTGYYDNWDYYGTPANWQYHVVKLDTSGKVLWDSRITGSDTFNTSGVVYFQGKNGNLYCVWSNLFYGPHMNPLNDSYTEQPNMNHSIWMAEIDHLSGKVLWRKSLKDSYKWYKLFSTSTFDYTTFLDVAVSDSMAVFVGKKQALLNNKPNTKIYPIVMAIDFNGIFQWYREFDFYPNDTGDDGFNPYSIIPVDSSYLLTGDYFTAGGQASNGISFQKGAILKLDKNGCFTEECDKYDNVNYHSVSDRRFRLYPNPANEYIIIDVPYLKLETKFYIYNQFSKLVKMGQLADKKIDVSDLKSGVYFISLDAGLGNGNCGIVIINH